MAPERGWRPDGKAYRSPLAWAQDDTRLLEGVPFFRQAAYGELICPARASVSEVNRDTDSVAGRHRAMRRLDGHLYA